MVPRAGGYAHDAKVGCDHHSRAIFCRAVPDPNVTIRTFFFALQVERLSAAAERAAERAIAAEAEAARLPALLDGVASLERSLAAEQALRQRSSLANRDEIVKVNDLVDELRTKMTDYRGKYMDMQVSSAAPHWPVCCESDDWSKARQRLVEYNNTLGQRLQGRRTGYNRVPGIVGSRNGGVSPFPKHF
jgi:hypothetical protein